MRLQPPALDDRTFEELIEAARQRAAEVCPDWTDMSAGDPGTTLLELFAYLTETLLFRLNRLPEKAYVELLRLVGVTLHPPTAAQVELLFHRANDADTGECIDIPRGTRVAAEDGTTFVTMRASAIQRDERSVGVLAAHCETVLGKLLGTGSGRPGLSLSLSDSVIARVAAEGDHDQSLVVGIESTSEEIGDGPSRRAGDQLFRIWSETDFFGNGIDPFVFVADRAAGRITFAPAIRSFENGVGANNAKALAGIPAEGREIRAWYLRGGGTAGNVAAGQLTQLLDPIDGVAVTNPQRAIGGGDIESVRNAIVRGPQQLYSRDRVVTARDFELSACDLPAVARARAAAMSEQWAHGAAGTVELMLVPEIPANRRPGGRVTTEQVRSHQTVHALEQVLASLSARRPLGCTIQARWIDYQEAFVRATICVQPNEDPALLEAGVRSRLDALLSPLPTERQPDGWPFDQPLQLGRVYDEIFQQPGVTEVEFLRLVLADAPTDPVPSLAADAHQAKTWFAASGRHLFRSLNDGETWQRLELPLDSDIEANHQPRIIRTHPSVAGGVAVLAAPDATEPSSVFVSLDCGQSFELATRLGFRVHDAVWTQRNGIPTLLLCSDRGLYEWSSGAAAPRQVTIAGLPAATGVWTVAVAHDVAGNATMVAVAAKDSHGVWISYEGGLSQTFVSIGLAEHDIRTLAFQTAGQRTVLWAGATVVGSLAGRGAFRWIGPAPEWQQAVEGWRGGSCLALAARGSTLYAGTHDGGVLSLDTSQSAKLVWRSTTLESGLPQRDHDHPFHRTEALAIASDGTLMIGGSNGVYRSSDSARSFDSISRREFVDLIQLPPHTLFVPGRHELTVRVKQ